MDIAKKAKLFQRYPGMEKYQWFSDDALLSRWLDEKTQNQNTALNGKIVDRVPKDVFVRPGA